MRHYLGLIFIVHAANDEDGDDLYREFLSLSLASADPSSPSISYTDDMHFEVVSRALLR